MFPAQDHRRIGIKRDGSVASTTGEHGCLAQIKSPCFLLPLQTSFLFFVTLRIPVPPPSVWGPKQ